MCGIAAVLSLSHEPLPRLARAVSVMNALQRHRGPDGEGAWLHPQRVVGFGHRRLNVIDLESGRQPMADPWGNWITYNGETYNYRELREQLTSGPFRTQSDTEVLLHAYRKWGPDCLTELRGMFAFALWDEAEQTLFCARDRFGIKPLYYAVADGVLYVASEVKALLPFLPAIETDLDGLRDYLAFQWLLNGKTLFKGVHELRPGHLMRVRNGTVEIRRYWAPSHQPDLGSTGSGIEERIRGLLDESMSLHLRSDVPVGAYVSGGLDSSVVAALAAARQGAGLLGFTGKFSAHPAYDESRFARELASRGRLTIHEIDITAEDFVRVVEDVVYHLDFPVAGPGAVPQYVVSGAARPYRKVLLGGQGGDELFGGYARYLIASLATGGSATPGAETLRAYAPLLEELSREGPVEDLERRYFRLINRSGTLGEEINWPALGPFSPFETFREVFRPHRAPGTSDLQAMMSFDFENALPALLQVEDRVSMAHGVESRVPLLDHPLVEFVATIPSALKVKDGTLKHVLRSAMEHRLPASIVTRRDKMGFPVPFHEWLAGPGPLRGFVTDVFSSRPALERDLVDGRSVVARLDAEPPFGRTIWGLLCLELWQRAFHDRSARYRRLLTEEAHA